MTDTATIKQLSINEELLSICRKISAENLTIEEWRDQESSGQFQTLKFCGGFDTTEDAFTFSYFGIDNTEWWFQFTLPQVAQILAGDLTHLPMNKAKQ